MHSRRDRGISCIPSLVCVNELLNRGAAGVGGNNELGCFIWGIGGRS